MIPLDLNNKNEDQPYDYNEKYSAVLFTGNSLRHKRLGYLIQYSFPGLIKAWYTTVPKNTSKNEKFKKIVQKILPLNPSDSNLSANEIIKKAFKKGIKNNFKYAYNAMHGQLIKLQYPSEEQNMFGWEVEHLIKSADIHPATIVNPNSTEQLEVMKNINPYFLLTFGGPLLGNKLLNTVRGYAINQHAGYSPDLKGANTTEMAIYQRRVDKIGSTVHLMDVYADAGPIIRRSLATIHEDDTTGNCFLSVTALGNHLLIEAVSNILNSKTFSTFEQGTGTGQTILNQDLSTYRKKIIKQDQSAMIKAELESLRNF